MSSLSIVVPDVAAAVSLAARLARAGADVRIEPARAHLWRVWGKSSATAAATRALVSDWAHREQIFCTSLTLGS